MEHILAFFHGQLLELIHPDALHRVLRDQFFLRERHQPIAAQLGQILFIHQMIRQCQPVCQCLQGLLPGNLLLSAQVQFICHVHFPLRCQLLRIFQSSPTPASAAPAATALPRPPPCIRSIAFLASSWPWSAAFLYHFRASSLFCVSPPMPFS